MFAQGLASSRVPHEVAAAVHEALMEQAELARRRLSARLQHATESLALAEQARAADATALAAALAAKEQVMLHLCSHMRRGQEGEGLGTFFAISFTFEIK